MTNGNDQGFSIQNTSADQLNEADVKIEDMSQKVLHHRESVVSMQRHPSAHRKSVSDAEEALAHDRVNSAHSQRLEEGYQDEQGIVIIMFYVTMPVCKGRNQFQLCCMDKYNNNILLNEH